MSKVCRTCKWWGKNDPAVDEQGRKECSYRPLHTFEPTASFDYCRGYMRLSAEAGLKRAAVCVVQPGNRATPTKQRPGMEATP